VAAKKPAKKPAKKAARKPVKAAKAKSSPARKAAPAKKAAPARKAAAARKPAAVKKLAMVKLDQAQAIAMLNGAIGEVVRSSMPDLTARQMAVLLSVHSGGAPATVRGLAAALKLQKPAVSRALDRLGDLGYIERKVDQADRRNVLIKSTGAGNGYLRKFGDLLVRAGKMK